LTRGGWPPPATDTLPTKSRPSQAGGFRAPCVTQKGRILNHAHTCTLAAAEACRNRLGCPAGHYETWAAWRCGRPKPSLLLALTGATAAYEAWPRGRIVFDRPTQRFIIYADRQLLAPHRLARITAHFHLPPARTVAHTDPHYRNTLPIGRR